MTLPDVAQAYELEMGHQSLIAFIAERIEAAGHAPLRTHQLIAALPFKRIITTNWDTLLEEALRQAGKSVAKVVRNEDVAYVDEEKVTLIKLHGSIDQKDTIVVTGDDYYDVFARLPETANLVRSFFATKTLLFLGYGLADEDFKRMYHEVERHLGKHKRRAYAVQLNPTTLAVKYWQQKNVEVIVADATAFLEALIRELGVTSPPPVPASTGMAPIPQSSTTPSTSASTVAPIGRPTGRSGGVNLERGLEAMKARLKGGDPDAYLTFSTLESRLLANIDEERVYGSSETVRSERARIVQELNRIALARFQSNFNELCER